MLTMTVDDDGGLEALIADALSPQYGGAVLISEARVAFVQAEADNLVALGHAPHHQILVDGRLVADGDRVADDIGRIGEVGADGRIECVFASLDQVLLFVRETLIAHSPVMSGRYQSSHLLFADGHLVDPDGAIPAASEYVFINSQPYARKIERGESPQFPEGVYEAVAVLAAQRFGNQAAISFEYSVLLGDSVVTRAGGAGRGRFGSASSRAASQPAIVIRPL